MKKNFWQKLKKPFFVQAPMSGVSDETFRLMFVKYGAPDVFWTEFISASALFTKKAEKYCLEVLKHSAKEKPIVAQIFGANIIEIERACKIVSKLKFDGIDINMGCPDNNVEKQGAGSALIKNPKLAKEVIRAAKKCKIPVSVKTRIGYSKDEIDSWIPAILEENVAALTVHFRTRKDGYVLPANWELAKKIVELRDKIAPDTLIIGNGDIKTLHEAKQKAQKYNLDGIMIGRALLGNPWFFSGKNPTEKQRLKAILEHNKLLPKEKHFDSVKKHFHAYCKNFVGAKELREALMRAKSKAGVKKLVEDFILKKH